MLDLDLAVLKLFGECKLAGVSLFEVFDISVDLRDVAMHLSSQFVTAKDGKHLLFFRINSINLVL